jgi:fatty-acyl-CoA synthase
MQLTTSYFPAQTDQEIRDITVGEVLRKIAATHGAAPAMVDIDDNGGCAGQWTYGELLNTAELRYVRALPL